MRLLEDHSFFFPPLGGLSLLTCLDWLDLLLVSIVKNILIDSKLRM